MAKSIARKQKYDPVVAFRYPSASLRAIDTWAKHNGLGRGDAIRLLLAMGLGMASWRQDYIRKLTSNMDGSCPEA